MFVLIEKRDAEYLFDTVESVLNDQGANIANCRSQSYVNANNMSGIYSGTNQELYALNYGSRSPLVFGSSMYLH
jgi:hypothetical protein